MVILPNPAICSKQRSPSQEDQLRIDRRHSKGSERSKSRPRSSVSYSTDPYRSWYREKDEAPKGQRRMGRRTRSSTLLEHHRLSGSHATLKRKLRERSIAPRYCAPPLHLASPDVSVQRRAPHLSYSSHRIGCVARNNFTSVFFEPRIARGPTYVTRSEFARDRNKPIHRASLSRILRSLNATRFIFLTDINENKRIDRFSFIPRSFKPFYLFTS